MSYSSLSRLIYASRWTDPDNDDSDGMLQDIIGRSIQNNRVADITGLLLFRQGWFLQVLEGDLDQIDETFDRIRRDGRHIDVRLVSDEPAERRAFSDWNMVATPLESLAPDELGELGLDGEFDPASLTPDTALSLMVIAGSAERQRERAALLSYNAV
jgi:hypothetical protein